MFKLSNDQKLLVGIVLFLVVLFALKQAGISNFARSGTTNCDLTYLKGLCRPGWVIWQQDVSSSVCSNSKEYFIGDYVDYPPTWPLTQNSVWVCADDYVCCRNNEGNYSQVLESQCNSPKYSVDISLCNQCTADKTSVCPDGSTKIEAQCIDGAYHYVTDICPVHECIKDADCPSITKTGANDCSMFWKPRNVTVNQICLNYECREPIASHAALPPCTNTQTFLQDYKWFIVGGAALLLLILLMMPPRAPPRRSSPRRSYYPQRTRTVRQQQGGQ